MDLSRRILFFLVLFLPAQLRAAPDPLLNAAKQLADKLSIQKNARIAVITIPYHDQRASEGPFVISERLATYLMADSRLKLVEREQIESLFQEMHLAQAGFLDRKNSAALGKMLGADIIVSGTLIDLSDGSTEVNIRGLLCGSGRVIAASRARVERTWLGPRTLGW